MNEPAKNTVGIIGAGRMGGGVAQICAQSGLNVVMVDARIKSVLAAMDQITKAFDDLVSSGKMSAQTKEAALARIQTGTDFSLLKRCDLCIEAVLENAGVKGRIHYKIREKAGKNLVIATNTATLSVSAFGKRDSAPENFLGMVFGFPPQTCAEVRLIKTSKTSPQAVALAEKIVRSIGKKPVLVPDHKPPRRVPCRDAMRFFLGIIALASLGLASILWMDLPCDMTRPLAGIGVAIIFAAVFALGAMVEKRLNRLRFLTRAMTSLAADDLNITVPDLDKQDEFGDMSRLVEIFKMMTVSLDRLAEEEAEKTHQATEQRHKLENLARKFEQNVGEVVNTVATAATVMNKDAKRLSDMASNSNRELSSVASTTQEAAVSVQTVAAAAEELSASIGEINRQVSESTQIARQAVADVKKTDETVSTLSEAAEHIGDVVNLIKDIAEQTNLLALNATIEAARAGEAGKGFAVVASEVKNLANQTSKATEEIVSKIATVQSVSTESVRAIRLIGQTIERINEITAVISDAVSQQTAATKEISHHAQQALTGTNNVTTNVTSVTQAAAESQDAATEVFQNSGELSKQAQILHEEILDFLNKIKHG